LIGPGDNQGYRKLAVFFHELLKGIIELLLVLKSALEYGEGDEWREVEEILFYCAVKSDVTSFSGFLLLF
jgi:hypothetical protein